MRHLRRSILVLVLLAIAFSGRAMLARRLGSISGNVSEAGGPVLAGVQVHFFNELGVEQLPFVTTDGSGNYTKSLAAGTYYVRTANTPTHVDILHSGIVCNNFCDPTDGTPVFLADLGALTIDFSLDKSTSISGTVTGTGGAGLVGVSVQVMDAGNQTVASANTIAGGVWTTPDIPAGSYFIRTFISSFSPSGIQGYVPELFDNIPCLTNPCVLASGTLVPTTVASPATGVTLALEEGGYFEGTVTSDGVSGQAGVFVDVLNMGGQRVAFSAQTTASGTFRTVPGLPPGPYVLRTQNSTGRINAFNDGSLCVGTFCTVTNETPIQIVGPGSISGVNFTLPAGAQIVGTLLGNGAVNLGLSLSVLSGTGASVTTANVDAAGTYRSRDGLPPGTYYLRTFNSQGFLNELGGGTICAPSCTVTSSTPVVVTTTGDVAGPNFDLAPGGRVSGVVRSSAPGNPPIGGATVTVVNAAGVFLTSGFTTSNGAYNTDAGILTGSDYRVITGNQTGMINVVYPSTPCEGTICNAAAGTTISVTAGAVPTNVDITLDPGGQFTGSVLSAGSPVAGASVQVLNTSGLTIATGNTDALGKYLTSTGLQTGSSYKIRTTNSLGFVNELYDNVVCGTSCNLAAGTAVGTTAGSPPAGPFSFDLAQGGRISGSVKDAGLTPLIGVNVQVFNPTTGTTVSGQTDGAGVFSIGGLSPGTYYARTSNTTGYINEAYDGGTGIPCVFTCNSLTLGAPLVIAGATDLTGIDFVLDAGARIAGFIQEDGGLPIPGVSITVVDAGGLTQSSGVTDAFGNYLTTVGLRPGKYLVRTSNSLGYLNEVYDNQPCTIPCTLSSATGVDVAGSGTFGGINFGLTKGGRVTGTIVDATTLLPLTNVSVGIADSSGRVIASGNSDATGTFISGAGLPTGTYYARTNNSQGYQDEIYNDVKCPQTCAVIAGASFSVTSGSTTPGINFALDKGGRVTGIVTNSSLEPISGVTVQLYDSTGKLYTSGFTNPFGIYTTGAGVPAGTYYARTQNGIGYINELYGGAQCLGNCLVTSGTSFLVAGTGTTSGIDFELTEGGRISGVITDGVSPISGVGVAIFDSTGVSVGGSASTNAIGVYTTSSGLPAGNYYVRTANNKGYINQLWNVGICLGCDVTTGNLIPVVLGSTTPGIDFTLTAGGRIGGTITRSDTAAGVPGALATVHNAAGLRVATGIADANGVYLTNEGLPNDTYFVRTENSAGLVNQIYLGLPCAVACDPTTGTGVPTTAPGTTGSIDFVLTPDADADADGIANTIDLSPVFSNDFSDVAQGGSTDGTIAARGGFTVSVGDILGGVQISLTGAGSSANIDTCATGGLERLTLDVAGETATVLCQPVTGSTFARALIASPTIEVRDPPTGGGTIAVLTTGQAVTLGSPVTADPSNDEAILVKIVDATGTQIGSFNLDPGESAEAIVSPAGAVDVTVVVGTVTVTVRGEEVTLDSGESFEFPPVTFVFSGFLNPVLNPPALNQAKSGSTIPVKFGLGGDEGLAIFAAGFPQSQAVNCSTGAPTGPVEAAVGTLQYDPVSGRYTYSWKTQKAWTGCRQLTLTFNDAAGTTATARFQFK